jgi:hypothetical protein
MADPFLTGWLLAGDLTTLIETGLGPDDAWRAPEDLGHCLDALDTLRARLGGSIPSAVMRQWKESQGYGTSTPTSEERQADG